MQPSVSPEPNFTPEIPPNCVEGPTTLPNSTALVETGEAAEAAETGAAAAEAVEAAPAVEAVAAGGLLAPLVAVLVFLWPNETAPAWMDEINPETGRPYKNEAEYKEVRKRRTEEAKKKLEKAKDDALPNAPANGSKEVCPQAGASASSQPQAVPQTKPRKYPDQTCEDERREELQSAKNRACNVPRSCKAQSLDCDEILRRIEQNKACLSAREQMRDECFGGSGDEAHKGAIEDVQDVLLACEQRASADGCL